MGDRNNTFLDILFRMSLYKREILKLPSGFFYHEGPVMNFGFSDSIDFMCFAIRQFDSFQWGLRIQDDTFRSFRTNQPYPVPR
jgi:hypothetical protein